jgi:hypothetical protein
MRAKRIETMMVLGCIALGGGPAWCQGLTYHPLVPCRIVDTRLWNNPVGPPSPMANGEIRAFDAIGTDFRLQGGFSGSCGVPPQDGNDVRVRAEAIAVNLVMVNAAGPGDLRAFPGNLAVAPLAAVINYTTGQTIAVGTVIPLRTDVVGDDFKIQADVNGGHVVVDVIGYYSRATSTSFFSHVTGLPAATGVGPILYGAVSGINPVTANLVAALFIGPVGCSASRLHVEESVIAQPGLRSYRLLAITAGGAQSDLLFCGTATIGHCVDQRSVAIPLGSERLVIETSSFGTVPLTSYFAGFDLVCE